MQKKIKIICSFQSRLIFDFGHVTALSSRASERGWHLLQVFVVLHRTRRHIKLTHAL